ncbi:MAG: PQQ-binding-like beta-propeller repeat protein [Thermoplasmata archaeon]
MKRLCIIFLICLMLSITVPGQTSVNSEEEGEVETPWSGFGRDQRNTGLSPYLTEQINQKNHRSWEDMEPFRSSPAVSVDSSIYIGSEDGNLNAFSFDSNFIKLWSFKTNGSVRSSPAIGNDGSIYFGSNDKSLYAVDFTSRLRWSFETEGMVRSSPVIDDQGTIYVGSFDNNLYAVHPNGTEMWRFETGGAVSSSPAIGSDGTVYIGSHDGNLYAVNNTRGRAKWRFETSAEIMSSPAIDNNGTIYIGSSNSRVYALNKEGVVRWEFATQGAVISSPSLGPNGDVYFGSEDGHLYSFDENGTLKWKFRTGDAIVSSPAVGADGTIYFGSKDEHAYALNPDGTEKWRMNTRGEIVSSPAIGILGTVYIASTRGIIYAFVGVPSTPEELSVEVDDGKLTLNWEPPPDLGGGEIMGYRIYKGTEPDKISLSTVIPETLTFTDDEVTIGQTYYYQISGINFVGEGERTDIVNTTAAVLPDQPKELETYSGDTVVEISWKPPDFQGGVELDEYYIYRKEEDSELVLIDTVPANTLEYEDQNVTNRVSYHYRVSAVNAAGEGRRSKEITAMPTANYSVLYCFLLPITIIASLLALWFIHWYRRWGRYSPPQFQDDLKTDTVRRDNHK